MENWTRCDSPIKVMKMVFNIMTKEASRKNIRRILLGNGINLLYSNYLISIDSNQYVNASSTPELRI